MAISTNSSNQSLKACFPAHAIGLMASPFWVQVEDARALALLVERLVVFARDNDLAEVHVEFTSHKWGPQNCTDIVATDSERLVVGQGCFWIESTVDDLGGKYESEAIDIVGFAQAVVNSADSVLYFPSESAQALQSEIEEYEAETGILLRQPSFVVREPVAGDLLVDGTDTRFRGEHTVEFAGQFRSALLNDDALDTLRRGDVRIGKRLPVEASHVVFNVFFQTPELLFKVYDQGGRFISYFFARALAGLAT